jgi:hypothetical protein
MIHRALACRTLAGGGVWRRFSDAICTILRRYMVLPKHAAEAMALWVLHA